jgi:hypothetical protein
MAVTPVEEHETTHIAIKTVKVDEYIRPVVQWLNDFPGVITRWSCEGEPGDNTDNKPYVVFSCEDSLRGLRILVNDSEVSK